MRPYTALCAHLLFPLHERLKGHASVAIRRNMEETQWWSASDLARLQVQRLRSFLQSVNAHVPYYAALFREAGLDPDRVESTEDLRRLPLLTKSLIRANTEAMKSRRATDLKRFNTGGSSGEPLIFYIGRERVSHDVAAKWRATRWWDVDIGDREIVVWGSPIELGAQDRVRVWRDRLLRSRLLPAFEMSDAKLDGFVDAIERFRPRMLFGYPSSLTRIAQHARKRGRDLSRVGVHVAFVTSERLYDEQRATIESAFGCRVANGYGGRDAGFIAHQCPQGSMHITAEDIVVETLDSAGQPVPAGTPGEIVVTHLATRDFPFIRYGTGDVGVLDDRPCACGRGLPVLREIQGRSTDFIVAKDGTVMHGLALVYIVRDLPTVAAFKIVQESLDHTRVLVVPAEGFSARDREQIVNGMRARLGAEVRVSVEEVAELAPEKSGKFRYVMSRVAA